MLQPRCSGKLCCSVQLSFFLWGPAAMPAAGFKHVSVGEGAIMRKLHAEGMGVRKIGALLSRSSDTVSKHMFNKHIKKEPIPKGRPHVITTALFKKMEKEYQKLLNKSQPHEVTIAMLKERMGLTCSDKTVSRAFWQRSIHFMLLDLVALHIGWALDFPGFSYLLIQYIVAN